MPEIQQVLFEWGDPGDGSQQVMYLGRAAIGVPTDEPVWEIKKFFYDIAADFNYYVSEIKTLNGKAWTERATLPWT